MKYNINMEKKFENKGKAWANSRKDKPTQPDWKGKGNFNGVDFEFSMWFNAPLNSEENGSFSVQFSEPYIKKDTPTQTFNPRSYAINEADKMFSKDIEQEFEQEDDRDIF